MKKVSDIRKARSAGEADYIFHESLCRHLDEDTIQRIKTNSPLPSEADSDFFRFRAAVWQSRIQRYRLLDDMDIRGRLRYHIQYAFAKYSPQVLQHLGDGDVPYAERNDHGFLSAARAWRDYHSSGTTA